MTEKQNYLIRMIRVKLEIAVMDLNEHDCNEVHSVIRIRDSLNLLIKLEGEINNGRV